MTVPYGNWTMFMCIRCGWATPGNYERKGTFVPDTDCPSCKSHDVVRDLEIEVPEPLEPELLEARLKPDWLLDPPDVPTGV